MNKLLTRSRTDVILGGVCSGLANYLGIDPVFVRIFFILVGIFGGFAVLLYLILWVVMPQEGAVESSGAFSNRAQQVGTEFGRAVSKPNPAAAVYIGVGLILAGLFAFLRSLNIEWLQWLDGRLVWPLILIVGGGFLLYNAFKEK
ncbi:MAG: PspC domain-containing protein [Anaerolineaceae bacterium]|nr:PspC domain-containing protein [Anaerolineaceae bacterium]